jgi:hypothetical protein
VLSCNVPIDYTKTLSLILMSIFYNNNRAIKYLSLRVESTTVCVQKKTVEIKLKYCQGAHIIKLTY